MSPIFPSWDFSHWHAVDDRVRGGSSISHLEPYTLSPSIAQSIDDEKGIGARFHGTLDITTLGGAGFASQRYMFGPSPSNLPRHKYSGIILDVLCDPAIPTLASNHPSNFTLVLQTTISSKVPQKPRTPSDPQAARLAYEADFCIPTDLDFDKSHRIHLGFDDFIATYRGRQVDKSDPRWQPLHSEQIYELSLMCRSGFGKQSGEFGVVVASVLGWKIEGDARDLETQNHGFTLLGRAWNWIVSFVLWAGRIGGLYTGEGAITLQDKVEA